MVVLRLIQNVKHACRFVQLIIDIDYFKKLAEETGVPYQNLINLYLQDCAHSHKIPRPKLSDF